MNPSSDDRHWLAFDGEQRGPFTLRQLQSMWTAGSITGETLYWKEGFGEDWCPLWMMQQQLEPQPPIAPPPTPLTDSRVQYLAAQAAPKPRSGCDIIILIALGIIVAVVALSLG